ncbi:MAG: hypothetical protein JWM52_88 [Candidatus Saccharibacteria bacterium]|nr:hypothetical protein [Candidatus Saccharibacteria bacterium]
MDKKHYSQSLAGAQISLDMKNDPSNDESFFLAGDSGRVPGSRI